MNLNENDSLRLDNISKDIRRNIFKMALKANGGHLGAAFSIVEILTALYFGGVLKYDPEQPTWEERDRFVLSKGHAGITLYAVLAKAGFFKEDVLYTFCQEGTLLGGHPRMEDIPGVEASTGALGHGFAFAAGIAFAGKLDSKDYRVFTVIGDGECQEGTIWETALFAAHQKLGNFTAILDYNKLQAMDRLDSIIDMEPMAGKWINFGWDVSEINGHDIEQLITALVKKRSFDSRPRLIIAHTIKGKGVSFMENKPLWHYRLPNQEELKIALAELEIHEQELI